MTCHLPHQMLVLLHREVWNSPLQGVNCLSGHLYWGPAQWWLPSVTRVVSKRQGSTPVRLRCCCPGQVLAMMKRSWLLQRRTPFVRQKRGEWLNRIGRNIDFHMVLVDDSREISVWTRMSENYCTSVNRAHDLFRARPLISSARRTRRNWSWQCVLPTRRTAPAPLHLSRSAVSKIPPSFLPSPFQSSEKDIHTKELTAGEMLIWGRREPTLS